MERLKKISNPIKEIEKISKKTITQLFFKGQPAFLASEIGDAFGLVELGNNLSNSCYLREGVDYLVLHGEDFLQIKSLAETFNKKIGGAKVSLILESGLYKLAFHSSKENCKKFKNWVTREVLPSIRESGSYSIFNRKMIGVNNIGTISSSHKAFKNAIGFSVEEIQEMANLVGLPDTPIDMLIKKICPENIPLLEEMEGMKITDNKVLKGMSELHAALMKI